MSRFSPARLSHPMHRSLATLRPALTALLATALLFCAGCAEVPNSNI